MRTVTQGDVYESDAISKEFVNEIIKRAYEEGHPSPQHLLFVVTEKIIMALLLHGDSPRDIADFLNVNRIDKRIKVGDFERFPWAAPRDTNAD